MNATWEIALMEEATTCNTEGRVATPLITRAHWSNRRLMYMHGPRDFYPPLLNLARVIGQKIVQLGTAHISRGANSLRQFDQIEQTKPHACRTKEGFSLPSLSKCLLWYMQPVRS